MSRVNTASIVEQLHALGFSMAAAQQLMSAQVLGDARDRRHLALFLAGLFEGGAVRAGAPGGRPSMRTTSGILIELEDESGGQATNRAGPSSAGRRTTPGVNRTASGIIISFEDDA